jgi:hypothetical protein
VTGHREVNERVIRDPRQLLNLGCRFKISKSPDPASLALGKEYHSRNRLTILHAA